MNLSLLSPWQLMLWIVCLEVLSIPLIVILVNSIIIGYFKAKRDHIGKMANSFAKAFEKIADNMLKTINKKETDKDMVIDPKKEEKTNGE